MAIHIDHLVASYKKIEEYNDDAVGVITDIAQNKFVTAKQRNDLVYAVRKMQDSFGVMLNNFSNYEGLTIPQYKMSLDARVLDIAKQLSTESFFSVNESEIELMRFRLSPHIFDRIAQMTAKYIVDVNPRLYSERESYVATLKDVQTPHDLVRYMHKNSSNLLFNPDLNWEASSSANSIDGSNIFLRMFNLEKDKDAKPNPFIEHLIQIIRNNEFVNKSDAHNIYAMHDAANVNMNLPLGCHFARITIKKSSAGYQLGFKFIDTVQYNASKFRTQFAAKALKYMGYTVQKQENILNCATEFNDCRPAMTLFESTLRFAFSIRNLDNYGNGTEGFNAITARETDMLRAFFAGVMNLRHYLDHTKGAITMYIQEHHKTPARKDSKWKPLFPELAKTIKIRERKRAPKK